MARWLYNSTPRPDNPRSQERVLPDVGPHIEDHGAGSDDLCEQLELLALMTPDPAAVGARANDPTSSFQRTGENGNNHASGDEFQREADDPAQRCLARDSRTQSHTYLIIIWGAHSGPESPASPRVYVKTPKSLQEIPRIEWLAPHRPPIPEVEGDQAEEHCGMIRPPLAML